MKKLYLILLFTITGFGQTQIGNDVDGEVAGDQSGWSVSLSSTGNILAVGAILNNSQSGHVRVFQNSLGVWTQIGGDINGEAVGDQSGYSVSISSDGNIVAIGAPSNDGNGTDSGHVRVFQNNLGVWMQIGDDINGEAADDNSGYSVSLSSDGNIVAIGAPNNNGGGANSGHVRVYKNISGVWVQIGNDIDGEALGDRSGRSVYLSSDGNIVAIGATANDGNGVDSGHVRVYQNNSGVWTQIGGDINGEAAGDASGRSVSLSSDGSVLAVGATNNDGNGNNSGHVRVYKNISGVWMQIGSDINGEAPDNHCGYSVSLSSDGSVISIGADGNSDNGNNSGHVRVFQNISGVWTQIGIDINGEGIGDYSGSSVSISSDAGILAIGAPGNDGNGNGSGHVRIYNLSTILASDSFVQANFKIYPNPVFHTLYVELANYLELQKINLYTATGQLIKTTFVGEITISDLSKGTYFAEVHTNKGKATKKILVE